MLTITQVNWVTKVKASDTDIVYSFRDGTIVIRGDIIKFAWNDTEPREELFSNIVDNHSQTTPEELVDFWANNNYYGGGFSGSSESTPTTVQFSATARDSFGNLKTSEPLTEFDSKQIFDNQPLFWDDQERSGSGTSSTYTKNRASTTIGVSNLTAGNRTRQTYKSFNYQTGKSFNVFETFVMGSPVSGVTKRIGYFDDNNGIFLECSDDYYLVLRSNVTGTPVEEKIAQSNWNIDTLNGSGLSGVTIDFTKAQIFAIEFQWLGVGDVVLGFDIGRETILVHQFNNSNVKDAVYMSTPNLPLRYEISNDGTGGAATLEHVCSNVQVKGGRALTGETRSVTRGDDEFTATTVNTWYPVISIRLKSTSIGAVIKSFRASVSCTSNSFYYVALIANPIIGGTDNASWVSVPNANFEYDISRDSTNPITIDSGRSRLIDAVTVATSSDDIQFRADSDYYPGFSIDGTQEELCLAVLKTAGASEDFLASLTIQDFA